MTQEQKIKEQIQFVINVLLKEYPNGLFFGDFSYMCWVYDIEDK